MAERVLPQVQAAKMGDLRKVYGVTPRGKARPLATGAFGGSAPQIFLVPHQILLCTEASF